MIDSWLILCLFALSSFRLTRLIVFDKITSFLRKPFHDEVEVQEEDGSISTYIQMKGSGLRRWVGELLSCYWCTGIWCSLILYISWQLYPYITEPVIIILAIAGCAGIIETIINKIID